MGCETGRVSADPLGSLSEDYERAEAHYLALIRAAADREALGAAARAVATAAAAFNKEAYRKYHAQEEDAWMPLDQLTERTEVLEELWHDVARAYAGLLPDGTPATTATTSPADPPANGSPR